MRSDDMRKVLRRFMVVSCLAWAAAVAPITDLMRSKLKAIPAGAKAVAGDDGFRPGRRRLLLALGLIARLMSRR